MAVTWEELQAHNTACSLLEEVLVKTFGGCDEIQNHEAGSAIEARTVSGEVSDD
jgi:hypothetical protein